MEGVALGTGWKWAVAVPWWWWWVRDAAVLSVSGEWVAAEAVDRRSGMSTRRRGRWWRAMAGFGLANSKWDGDGMDRPSGGGRGL
jgi:hypothetical protein